MSSKNDDSTLISMISFILSFPFYAYRSLPVAPFFISARLLTSIGGKIIGWVNNILRLPVGESAIALASRGYG